MSTHPSTIDRTADRGLRNIIEPLASYICAAREPRAALLVAYRALLSEVEMTNRAAHAHFGARAKSR